MLVMGGKYAKKNNIINLIFNRSSVIFIYTNTGQCPFKHQITPLQTAQGNRCSSIAHLGRKKRARKGKTNGSAKLRHPCKHRWHTPCCVPLTPLSLRLVLAKGVPARFFFQAFAQSSPAATLAPKPFKVSLSLNIITLGATAAYC